MVDVINALEPKRRLAFYASITLLIVFFICSVVWLMLPKYDSLFEGVDEESAAKIIGHLEEQKVTYEVKNTDTGSTILVPSEHVEKLQVTLGADLGLPEVKGLELFDNADYSMTDFSQDVTYKRAIQGELARTITSMPGIKNTRVHVTFAPKRLFHADKKKAKASIFIEQNEEVTLNPAQVSGIKRLVANAIESLDESNVSVFNKDGTELDASDKLNLANQIDKKYEAKTLVEANLTEKAYRLLTLFISPEKIAVSVDVKMNFDQRRKTKQGYATNADGEGLVVRQREINTEKQAVDAKINSSPVFTKEMEKEFTHGQEMEETVYSSGEVVQLNVGIAIRESLTSEQILKIREIISVGLGINTARGDRLALEVLNLPPVSDLKNVKNESVVATPQALNSSHIDSDTSMKDQFNNLFINNPVFWLLLLSILVAVGGIIKHKRSAQLKERRALLLEFQSWLSKEEQVNGKL
ncbi:flagellar basal-body MS-ring/collar protein FliF [Flocculibacter collagenilyticus]|uniref:flagellar basal-body MS-ring/collar protein FliF n=1 Tax=Flocculibacter collagenilyticus TaxID=2744479 RepID=UPI0018F32DD5|nr:flagellar basal-body MS-ring/collar protein FliF [Flocculibacter collagenilyticus]